MAAPDPFAPPRSWSPFRSCGSLALFCLLLLLGWCQLAVARDDSLRYRLRVEIQTPRGPRAGAGVIEARFKINFLGDGSRSWRGDAVAVDLPDGRVLFALPSWPEEEDYALGRPLTALETANPDPPRPASQRLDTRGERFERLRASRASAELRGDMPMLVVFVNPADPASASRVTPDNIQAVLGPGYAIRRVRVEATDEEVTRGVAARLPWLERDREPPARLAGGRLRPPETRLQARHFTR